MALRYLLDTNSASYALRGNMPGVRQRLLQLPAEDVAISVITEAELRFGAARLPLVARVRVLVREFLDTYKSFPWSSDAAVEYANLRVEFERMGTPIGPLDLMIAAHALAIGVVLVSHDRVFRRVPGIELEDWT
ncbi:MAG TPA: type II toxin-antitoxin system VapC family toxin [Terriglobales bacterium]|nr:type II toxin-antitoxin system VapC family toxin [Terriglobales bacterium]